MYGCRVSWYRIYSLKNLSVVWLTIDVEVKLIELIIDQSVCEIQIVLLVEGDTSISLFNFELRILSEIWT